VVIDADTADMLGIDTDLLRSLHGARLVDHESDLSAELRRALAAIQYELETDELHPNVTVLITASATALDAFLEREDETCALILGPWDRAWIELAPDGTPTECSLPDLELAQLGHCYGIGKQECNALLAELTGPDAGESDRTEPEGQNEEIEAEEQPATPPSPSFEQGTAASDRPQRFMLQLFGSHSLTWDGREVHFGRKACVELIAVMALTGWSLTRDELNEVVAGDATLKQARSRRTTIVGEARKVLTELTGTEDILQFHRTREIYRLDQAWFQTDLAAFEEDLERARNVEGTEHRAQHLTEALQRYAGPVGTDLDEVWDLTDTRKDHRDLAYQAALDLAEIHQEAGRGDQAAAVLERAGVIDTTRVEAWQLLAELHRRNRDEARAEKAEARARRLRGPVLPPTAIRWWRRGLGHHHVCPNELGWWVVKGTDGPLDPGS
jgi:DNA-binding SARP family transcriptional activator